MVTWLRLLDLDLEWYGTRVYGAENGCVVAWNTFFSSLVCWIKRAHCGIPRNSPTKSSASSKQNTIVMLVEQIYCCAIYVQFFHTLSVDFSIMLLTWAAKIWKTYINLYPTTVLHTYFWLHVIYKLSKIHLELYHYNDMYWFAAVAGISQIDQLCWGYVSVTGIWSSDGSHLDSAVVGPQTRLLASDAKFAAPAAWKINVREKQRSQRYDHLSMCSHVLEGHGWLIM